MAKILLSGCGGFLGTSLRERLSKNHELLCIEGRRDWESGLVKALSFAPDCILHLGFTTDFAIAKASLTESPNIRNTRTLGDFAQSQKTPHFIFVSAAAVLGVSATPVERNEGDLNSSEFPRWLQSRYVQEKLAAESYLNSLQLPSLTTLYPTTCYGPRMHPKALKGFVKLRSKMPWALSPPGGTSFLGLEDFARALLVSIEQRLRGAFVVSSGNCRYEELLAAAASTQKHPKKILTLPQGLRPLATRLSRDLILESSFGYKYYSAQKLQQSGAWSPQQNLQECLQEALS